MDLLSLVAKLSLDTSEYESGLEKTESDAKSFGGRLGSALKTAGKIGAAGIGVAGTAVTALAKNAVSSYANYEQLVGGVETLYKKDAKTLQKLADKAYKTAGLSANAYMETSTSMAAALVSSLGGDTEKAVEYADTAITDMSDNANKMGTSMESIQNAYNGFAKGNYTMLDNLKLGFGGTKEEMVRLLDKAEEISGYKYDISSYSDIVQAIHVVQTEIGITGTTQKEAGSTISGSLGMVKGSWENLVTAFGRGGKDTSVAIGDLIDSTKTFLNNLIPVASTVLENIGNAIKDVVPKIAAQLPDLISELAPKAVSAALTLMQSVMSAIVGIDWVKLGTDIWNFVVAGLSSMVSNFTQIYINAKNAITEIDWVQVGVDIWNFIVQGIGDLVSAFTSLFTGGKDGAETGVDWTGLGTAILDYVKEAFKAIGDVFAGIFGEAKKAIKNIDWSNVGTTILNAITSIVGKIGQWAKSAFSVAWSLIKSIDWLGLGKSIWDWLIDKVKGAGIWFKAIFDFVVEQIKSIDWVGLSQAVWDWIIEKIKDAGTWFKGVFDFVVEQIKSIDWVALSQAVWDWIIEKIKDAATWFKGIFEFALTQVKNINWTKLGQDIWDGIINKLKDAATWMKGVFDFAVSQVKRIDWLQLGKDIWNGVINKVKGVGDYFYDKFKTAREWVRDNISWSNLGSEIWNGIKSAFSNVTSFFTSIFDFSNIHIKFPHITVKEWWDVGPLSIPYSFGVSWYKKAYKNAMMFTSPTVLGTPYGLKGFGDGNGGEIVLSDRKLREIAGGGETTQNFTFNIYTQPGQDEEEIARKVQEQFIMWEDQRRAAYV